MTRLRAGAVLAAAIGVLCAAPSQAQQATMGFFVTSAGPGKGADLGGLAGADAHCQQLAAAAGAGGKTWQAYLSTQGAGAVNARDRIGKGPWMNAKGVVIAKDVAELHGTNMLTKQTALSEKGEVINGRGDTPNRHDILTGSQPDGTAFPPDKDMTCGTGPAARKAPPWSVIMTASACATTNPRSHGTRRIRRAARPAVAPRPICAAPAATACCIASPPTSRRSAQMYATRFPAWRFAMRAARAAAICTKSGLEYLRV